MSQTFPSKSTPYLYLYNFLVSFNGQEPLQLKDDVK